MIGEDTVIARSPNQVTCEMLNELLILQTASGRYYGLNELGSRAWALLEQPRRMAEIRDALLAEYEVDRETCTRDLVSLFEKLASKQLIEVDPAPAP